MPRNIILIPTRLESKRLPSKALLKIENLPIILHTYYRAKLSKLADEVYVCTHSSKIINECKKYNIKYIKTSDHPRNGTERIAEAIKKIKSHKKDTIIDVQGDEPLIDPKNIDKTIKFFKKNKFNIVVPNIKISVNQAINKNIVKMIVNNKNKIIWMSRSRIPFLHNLKKNFFLKHLSVIVFTKESLLKYSKLKKSKYEMIESIELLRAIENNLNLGSTTLRGDSFSIDVINDYKNALIAFKNDKIKKKYLGKIKKIS
jgi:3-deoxy-manno-octulosonate cytidylyltransferase (CMP-KDO synthetase)